MMLEAPPEMTMPLPAAILDLDANGVPVELVDVKGHRPRRSW